MTSCTEVDAQNGRPPFAKEPRPPREHWPRWAGMLRRYQLDGLAALLLDAGGPLVLLAAQALYVGRPFLWGGVDRLIHLLESEDEAGAFAAYLETRTQTARVGGSGEART